MPLVSLQPRIEYLSSRLSVVVAEADGLTGLNPFNMLQDLKFCRPSGSKSEPKVIGEVLNEYFHSDSPLAKSFRKFLASKEKSAGKGEEA